MPLGVADVHPGQIGGEQCRFFAALTGFDLEHDVVGVMRVARRQHVGELGVQFGHARLQFGDLVGERLVVDGQFTRGLQVAARRHQLAVGGDDRGQAGEPAPDFARLVGLAVQFGIRQRMLELGVFGEQHVDRLYGLRHVTLPSSAAASVPQTRTDARPVHVAAQFGRR